MSKTYVCVGNMRNGKSYQRALDMAQTIMQEYPNQSVCVISLDDYKQALADERRKLIAFIAEHTHCRTDCENILNCDGKKCWNKYLDMYEKEQQ